MMVCVVRGLDYDWANTKENLNCTRNCMNFRRKRFFFVVVSKCREWAWEWHSKMRSKQSEIRFSRWMCAETRLKRPLVQQKHFRFDKKPIHMAHSVARMADTKHENMTRKTRSTDLHTFSAKRAFLFLRKCKKTTRTEIGSRRASIVWVRVVWMNAAKLLLL